MGLLGQGWFDLQDELARTNAEVEQKLLAVGNAAANMTTGEELASFVKSSDMSRPAYKRIAGRMARFKKASRVDWVGILGQRDGNYHFMVDGDLDNTLPLNYPMFDRWPALKEAFGGKTVYATGLVDEMGRWDSVFVPVKDSNKRVQGVVSVQMVSAVTHLVAASVRPVISLEMWEPVHLMARLRILKVIVGSATTVMAQASVLQSLQERIRWITAHRFHRRSAAD